ncbi:hypothetical protein GQ43DRAFT_38475 [Delitschia confertaspora ATCC 74209]|uniref:Uncharacterized protein n=1 Tax=Delitschia confertaspora ATCC 74209 TaxID=1513339 RepID=A0A9P4MSE4_9PLEO|nr:hypothetical protein GQ43DRAFT_38475 [Delitschia confertaspora ATCC 74209]
MSSSSFLRIASRVLFPFVSARENIYFSSVQIRRVSWSILLVIHILFSPSLSVKNNSCSDIRPCHSKPCVLTYSCFKCCQTLSNSLLPGNAVHEVTEAKLLKYI